MKNLAIFLILIVFSLSVKAQYPLIQGLGSDSALVWSKGGTKLRPIVISYADTTAANLQRIKQYPFSIISTTSTNELWYRNSAATKWEKFSSSSNSGNLPSIVRIIDSSHIEICNVNSCDTFTTTVTPQQIFILNDSTIRICDYANSCDTININPTPLIPTRVFVDSIYSLPAAKTDTLVYNNNGDSIHVKVYDRNCGLITPGVVTYDSLLIFGISPSVYILCSDGVRRTSVQTSITLDTADATFDRFDAIVLDSNGVNKVTGEPSSDPVQPQINPDQVLLTFILVGAGQTTPPVIVGCTTPDVTIYDENTGSPEWSHTASVTANFNNVVTPYHLTKDIGVGTWVGGENIIFTTPTTVTIRSYTYLKFALRSEFNMQPTNQFQVSWVTSAGASSVNVSDGVYGFSRSVTGSYQIITIPISDFSASSPGVALQMSIPATVSLRITFNGKNTHGILLDYIQLGGSCIEQPPTPPTTSHDNGFGIVKTVSGNAVSTQPNDVLNVVGTGINISATGKTVTFTNTGLTQANNGDTVLGGKVGLGGALIRNTDILTNTYTMNFGIGTDPNNNYLQFGGNSVGSEYFDNYFKNNSTGVFSEIVNGIAGNSGADLFAGKVGVLTNAIKARTDYVNIYSQNNGGSKMSEIRMDTFATVIYKGRFEEKKGADVAAANDLTLGLDGNLFIITGATQINAITTANWQEGSTISLVFSSTPTVKHNTAGGAGTASLLLAGSVDFTASANSVLNLVYEGSNWIETSRKVAAAGGGIAITADNGLTASTSTNVQLGGTLLQNTTVNVTSSYTLLFTGNNSNGTIKATSSTWYAIIGAASGAGIGVLGQAGTDGIGIEGTATTSYGVWGISSSSYGIYGTSTTGLGGAFSVNPSSTNTVAPALQVARTSSGTPASGIGLSIDLIQLTSNGTTTKTANQLISKLTTATTGAETSQYIITGVTGGTTQDWLTIGQSGYVKFRPMTVTEAGAIATAEGLMVFVSNTDGTFTSIGLWIFQNGAWKAL